MAASQYADIEPAFGPLANGLIDFVRLRASESVLDVGTGSGLAARASLSSCRTVLALDFSRAMLRSAKGYGVGNLLQSDMHDLALSSSVFDVVLASFALNSTDPVRCLSEIDRVLLPGGRFAMQEWGASDPLSMLVTDTIAIYAVDDPPSELDTVRTAVEIAVPWDDVDEPEDVVCMVKEAGFCDIAMEIVRPSVLLGSV